MPPLLPLPPPVLFPAKIVSSDGNGTIFYLNGYIIPKLLPSSYFADNFIGSVEDWLDVPT